MAPSSQEKYTYTDEGGEFVVVMPVSAAVYSFVRVFGFLLLSLRRSTSDPGVGAFS